MLTSLNWTYRDSTGAVLTAPPAFITQLEVKIFDKDLNVLYPTSAFPPSTTNYVLGPSFIWSSVGRIRAMYDDTLGNHYIVDYNRAAPDLSAITLFANAQFGFTANGLAGQNYTVQYSTTLSNWSTLLVTNAPVSSFQVLDVNATDSHRFYRVLLGF